MKILHFKRPIRSLDPQFFEVLQFKILSTKCFSEIYIMSIGVEVLLKTAVLYEELQFLGQVKSFVFSQEFSP